MATGDVRAASKSTRSGKIGLSGGEGLRGSPDWRTLVQLKSKFRRKLMGFIVWILVGLIAGWLAGQVMKGGGYGVLVDILLGIVGGLVGGWIFGLLGIWPGGGMIGSIIVAFVGAVILVGLTRLVKRA